MSFIIYICYSIKIKINDKIRIMYNKTYCKICLHKKQNTQV